ncbi:hypothetical protein CY34DRAFT_813359 [Suillus luteus UH-Slu-Lm8-n1]|uniref:Uncharacterized protein n=1 Tax=Suillus luteus UH-Slu-Lm8-n1 TaxID=930992 RepID=A0A0C9ZWJ0_9AGAM|nr:hypothetical protein CY34DRAFT_813359 [Suillus luteus UH-Slu-Lm8-n1]
MISHPNSATPTGGFLDFPTAQDGFGHSEHRDHQSGLWRSSQSHRDYVSLSSFHQNVASCESRRTTDSRTGFLQFDRGAPRVSISLTFCLPDTETLCNAIPLIVMSIAGRRGKTLRQLWADRTGNHDNSPHLKLFVPCSA